MLSRHVKSAAWIAVIVFTGVFASLMPAAAEPETPEWTTRIELGPSVQYFNWEEFSDAGLKLVEENGLRYALCVDADSRKGHYGWRGGLQVFAGEVNYKGYTWSLVPVRTDVFYAGTRLYLDAVPAHRFDSGLLLSAFAGLGGQGWLRDLDDTRTPAGEPVGGGEEWWGCLYGRLGMGAEYPVRPRTVLFAEAGVKLPIYARNEAEFFVTGSPSAGLEPEMTVSIFSAMGVRWRQIAVKLTYDTLRFDRSNTVENLYQPRSESDTISLSAAWIYSF